MKLRDHIGHRELRVQDSLHLHGLAGVIAQPEQQRMVITAGRCDDVSDALHCEFGVSGHGPSGVCKEQQTGVEPALYGRLADGSPPPIAAVPTRFYTCRRGQSGVCRRRAITGRMYQQSGDQR